ncbi:AlpA family phage regulatory protein [Aquitalea sp. S1-19]|nr:AlpA family phage regulatory protein [Aquitalea sp. S1-19]
MTVEHPRILRLAELCQRVGLSSSAVYDRLTPNSPRHDPTFPRQVSLGGGAVGWLEHEVSAWLQTRISARDISIDKASTARVTTPPLSIKSSGARQ